jgi:hypothetical protein
MVDLPARWGAGWIITDENFTSWEILAVSSLDLALKQIHLPAGGVSQAYPKGTLLYPLIFGRLEERPKPEAITDEALEIEFKIKENSAFAVRLTPASSTLQTVGNHIPEFQTAYKWTVTPNHSRPLDWTEMPDVVYEHVGFLREDQQRVYDHRTPRGQELEFYQSDRTSIAQIEYFWRVHRATTLRFMIPTYRGDLRMLADTPTPSHPTWIRCERSFFSNPGRLPQPGDPYVALINKNDFVTPYQLSSAVDVQPDETRLVSTVSVGAFTAKTTIISHLLLARFQENTLEWTYTTPYLGTTRIKFVELPHEYPRPPQMPHPPPALKEPAYLFIFREGAIRTDRFTSYENTLIVDQNINAGNITYKGTYVPAPFSFDSIKTNLKLDQEQLELKSWKFDGNPLNKMWPFALDAVLTVEIVEVDAVTPRSTTAHSRFFGDIWSVDSEYKATAIPYGNLFERKFPRFLLSVSDNYTVFSAPTGLAASAFKLSGTIHGAVSHTSQTLLVTSAAARTKVAYGLASYAPPTRDPPVPPDDYYAGGWLETGTGVNKEKRGILHSATASGSDITLSLDRPLLKAVANQSVDLYPGYDGSINILEYKFNKRENFGGHPYIPNVNPGVKAIQPQKTQGGKKG